jgi:transposase
MLVDGLDADLACATRHHCRAQMAPNRQPSAGHFTRRDAVAYMRAQWRRLDRRIAAFEAEFTSSAKEDKDARRLTTIRGPAS